MSEQGSHQQPPLSPAMSILVPLIVGAAVLVVAVFASSQFVDSRLESQARERLHLARQHLQRSLERRDAGDAEEAERAADQAVLLVPELATGYVFRAEARFALGRIQAAVEDYTTALKSAPDAMDRYNAYVGRGEALLALGRTKEAEEDLSKALALRQHQGRVHLLRAKAREALGKTAEAEADYDAARQLGMAPTTES